MGTVTDLARHTIEVGQLFIWVQMIVAVILVPAGFMLVRRLSQIRDALARINGSVSEINQWRIDHDKRVENDDKHHDQMHSSCANLHAERLAHLQTNIEQLWGRIGDRRRDITHTD